GPGVRGGQGPPLQGLELEDLRRQARELLQARSSCLEQLDRLRDALAAEARQAESTLEERVRALGAERFEELETRLSQATERRVRAEQTLDTAGQRARRAEELERALLPAERLKRGLEYLNATLGNRRVGSRPPFSQWLMERRQQELLEIASARMLEMTAGQFGFSAAFQIVDRNTGQARKPETLSGGEGFLASLSLALALSELVGRRGGRLEAFFLDEGFGSLSPECLDRALSALESLAGTGRMIGVISHVSGVAERLERVLRVVKTPQGSRLEEGPETEDLAPAVLAALTG
ncbi:MAG: SbcC/MukB-like Walker B domain-containing protein, partial [Candidatus Eremiobacterota bacterium]